MSALQTVESSLFGLAKNDFVKGLIVAVISAVITALTAIIQNGGGLPTANDLHYILTVALTAGLAYLGKNFVTNNQGQVLKADVPPKSPTP